MRKEFNYLTINTNFKLYYVLQQERLDFWYGLLYTVFKAAQLNGAITVLQNRNFLFMNPQYMFCEQFVKMCPNKRVHMLNLGGITFQRASWELRSWSPLFNVLLLKYQRGNFTKFWGNHTIAQHKWHNIEIPES